jgi:hypothetical protein
MVCPCGLGVVSSDEPARLAEMTDDNDPNDEGDDFVLNTHTQDELNAASEAVVDALRAGPNPQSYDQLEGNTQLDRGILAMVAVGLRSEELVRLEDDGHELLVWLI